MFDDYDKKAFGDYILNADESRFTIDLSRCNLIQIIARMISIKSKLSPNYGKQFSSLLHNLLLIQKDFKCKLMPWHVTDIFWSNFIPYCLQRGLALSTIKTLCSQLKTSVEWGARYNAKISNTYDILKIPPYSHQQIALTPDDVSRIYHFNIGTINRRSQYLRNMTRVKDMFVLSCNLGQRFSDMVRIDESCFDRNIFSILQQKTGTVARVDIDKMSIDRKTTYKILETYGYKAPVTGDISSYDRYIKQLLLYVGFTEKVKRECKINGYIQTKYYPKYKLIASHTARRTFATINVMRGFRISEIRRATGHRSESAFEKYICYYND